MTIDIHSKRKFRKKHLVTEGTVIVTEGKVTGGGGGGGG